MVGLRLPSSRAMSALAACRAAPQVHTKDSLGESIVCEACTLAKDSRDESIVCEACTLARDSLDESIAIVNPASRP